MNKCFIVFLLSALLTTHATAAHLHPEKYYQEKWCAEHNGQAEVVLADTWTRADCITPPICRKGTFLISKVL